MQNSNFVVDDGEFFVLLGPSGCGKTTTLRMIAGLELPTSGKIYARRRGRHACNRASERDIAFVFQLFALYPHMNVRKNIALSPASAGHAKSRDRASGSRRRRGFCSIDHLLDESVSGLAGGDRQRVALGRAIVRRPKCFLMDEPLGTLDAEFRELMVHELRELHNRIHATTVYVTHDQMEAMSMADKIAVMNHGRHRAVRHAAGDLRPAGHDVRRRFHRLAADEFSALSGGSSARRADRSRWMAPTSPCPRFTRISPVGEIALGVRPEHVRFDDAVASARQRLRHASISAPTQIVTVETGSGMVKARVPADPPLQSR